MIRTKEKTRRKGLTIFSMLFLVLVTFSSIYGQQTKIKGENKMKTSVIEVVIMKVKSGISDNEFLQAAKSVDETVSKLPGFISRDLAKDENGNWIDIVHWSDMESAKNAAEAIMQSQTCGIFFGMINEQSMKMYHFESLHQINK